MSLSVRRRRVYLDHASATPLAAEARAAITSASALFANPGGVHAEAVAARAALEESRARISAHLGVKAREIVFTSGLTESNVLAILGYARALERVRRTLAGTHWIVSAIEHASVLECFAEAERMGGAITHLAPDAAGRIAPAALADALRAETVFVSVGWGNSEIGIVQPLSALARVVRAHERAHGTRVMLHSDAGQAPLYISPHVHTAGLDLCSFGAGKLYGPRGIGCVFSALDTQLLPVLFGGGQERGMRPGTEDVALAAGFAAALDAVARERASEERRLRPLRDELARVICAHVPGAVVNGDCAHALPHLLNVSIPGVQSEYLVLLLDRAGFALSTKSACRQSEGESHVVAALLTAQERVDPWRARGTLRISLGRSTTFADLSAFARALVSSVPKASR